MAADHFDGKTILIVEDEYFVGTDLEQLLADAGANAVLVNTASAASAALTEARFDAAILDIHLQDESTYPLADALRRKSIPFIFLSGYLTIREGYTDIPFVDKPFTTETVINALKTLLAQPTR